MLNQWNEAKRWSPEEVADLVRRYSDDLVRYAFCIVGEANAAEEVALAAIADFVYRNERKGLPKAYLWRTAYCRAVDYYRRHRHQVSLSGLEDVLPAQSDVEEQAILAERKRMLYRALTQLSPDYRNVLCLHVLDNFSVEETGKIMGKNTKQVYNLLARAKVALKEALLKEGFDDEDL